MSNIIVGGEKALREYLNGDMMRDRLNSMASKYVSPDKIIRSALASVVKTPKLLDCTKESWAIALMQMAVIGLEVGQPFNHAALVPFKNSKKNVTECTFMPMYQGLVYLAMDSGIVTYVDARTVYRDDPFEWEYGSSPFVKHKSNYESKNRLEKDIVAFYSVIKTKGSDTPLIKVMSKEEVDLIQARSKNQDGFSPWKSDYADMGQKTVYKKNQKYAPIAQSRRLARAIEYDDRFQIGETVTEGEIEPLDKPEQLPEPKKELPEKPLSEMGVDEIPE